MGNPKQVSHDAARIMSPTMLGIYAGFAKRKVNILNIPQPGRAHMIANDLFIRIAGGPPKKTTCVSANPTNPSSDPRLCSFYSHWKKLKLQCPTLSNFSPDPNYLPLCFFLRPKSMSSHFQKLKIFSDLQIDKNPKLQL